VSQTPSTNDDEWALYAGHRARFTDTLVAASPGGASRLCVLGAGACNDLDVGRLAACFGEIHLVDIDASSLARGVSRQAPELRKKLRPHGGVDLSGLTKRLPKWKRRPPQPAQVQASAEQAVHDIAARLPGPFDVVASACVLTQMSFAVRTGLGDAHPALELVRLSVVATHLHTLVELTVPGGDAIFSTDLTSSTMFPAEELRSSTDLRETMSRAVGSGSAYHSGNPELIRTILATGQLGERTSEPELLEPWLWDGRHGRTYLVYAMRIRRHV
jgi:hypothetical protein